MIFVVNQNTTKTTVVRIVLVKHVACVVVSDHIKKSVNMTWRTDMSFKAAGVHIFAGSFSIGIQRAGFEIECVYENLGLGVETAKKNFSFPIIYPKAKWSSYQPKGINLVYANPPCSAFSIMGSNRGTDDPINDCMYECADLAMGLDPDIFIMESVLGLWTKGQDIIADLDKKFAGYQHVYLLTDSVIHGSPQIRPRFHYIASKYDFKLAPFNPLPVPTIADAIWDLQFEDNHEYVRASGQLGNLISYIPPGITAADIWRSCPEIRDDLYGQPFGPTRRIAWGSPGSVITGGPTVVHPNFDRFLSIREEARIFGYPDSFEFVGRTINKYAQIGKAVTCFAGQFLGACARETLQKEEPFVTREKFIDLLPYSQPAKDLRKLDWFGGRTKKELMDEYLGRKSNGNQVH